MFTGFEKIVEERIKEAILKGDFKNLENAGKPLVFEEDSHIPEDLRIAYKILKNANCLPPELEVKKEIRQTEELLDGMSDTKERYKTLKKLNFLILKLNQMRNTNIAFELPQRYAAKIADVIDKNHK